MAKYPRIIFAFLILFSAVIAKAQTGNYFLSHYSPGTDQFDYVCFDMAQDDKGVMYFATKGGILEFNGRDWDLMEDVSAVYSLQIDPSGKIYWGGAKGFGVISLDEHGFNKANVLSDSLVSDVFQSIIVGNNVYFLTDDLLYALGQDKQVTVIKPASAAETFLKTFELFGQLYASTDNGTYKLEGATLKPSGLNLTSDVVFASRIDNNYVIATSDNRVYTCSQDLVMKPVTLKDQAYLDAGVIVNGSWLNRQLLALGTLRGGVLFVNPLNGITQEITNYTTGLPDNEVYELMTDLNKNVWVAHDYGFTKISPYIPINSFNYYKGLQGNLLCVYSSNNNVYVGTSLGLFKLEKVEEYDELVYYVNVEIKPKEKSTQRKQTSEPEPEQVQEPTDTDSKKRGLFGFRRKNRNANKETGLPQNTKADTQETIADTDQQNPVYRRVKKTERVLRSLQFEFKKVQGIDAKVTHITEAHGRMLAAGLGGLYEVKNLSGKNILEEPIRYIFAPSKKNFVIVSNYNDDVRTLRFTESYLENVSLFSNLDDQIHYAFEGTENEIWLCGVNRIYRVQANGNDVRHKQTIPLTKRNTDKTAGVVLNNAVIVAMNDGFFQIDRSKNSLVKIDSLPKSNQYFAHDGNIIYRDQHGWRFLGDYRSESNLQLLNVFADLRFVASDEGSDNLWLISGSNGLYKFFGNRINPVVKEFPLFLKSIEHQDRKIVKLNEIIIDQEHSAVKFEVVRPDYINPAAVEFRYLLEGMQDEWTQWAPGNDIISFPYLPTGEYKLQVEARNIFGKVSALEPLSFKVLPPYWKRSWFYALEFAILASLVVLSFRLSTRYRFVSRLLSLLTIILLIEFIQTAINATFVTENSPVIDFIIQVVVALMILPVEGYLRNLMLRSLDSSGKFYQFIVPQKAPPVIMTKDPDRFYKETSDVDR